VANVKDLEATVDSLTKLLSTKTKIIINLEMSKMENGLKVRSICHCFLAAFSYISFFDLG